MATHLLDKPITVGGETHRHISVKNYSLDPTMAPPGKTVIEVLFASNFQYWKDLYGDQEHYEAEKQQAAIAVINHLEQRLPGITDQVEVVDVATPVTTERYTGNWQGSIMAWPVTTETMGKEEMSKTIPGLGDFYMIGQWVNGGGLPPAATSGRDVIHIICHQDKKPFVTQLP
jgi:phytoene dehydrogenase-like protein